MSSGTYKFLADDYTTYLVGRKAGLPVGYSMKDMSDDYASMIKEEFGGPVDVIGVSTGGSIAQHFAADHPNLVRRLVIHSSAYTLNDEAKKAQMDSAIFARRLNWRAAYAELLRLLLPSGGFRGSLTKPLIWLVSALAAVFESPENPSDFVVTVEAEDKHDFKARLSEILAPTLVVAGDNDPGYSVELFHETSEGIPNANLILYEGMGHPASGKQFGKDVLEFLGQGWLTDRINKRGP